jgi:arginase
MKKKTYTRRSFLSFTMPCLIVWPFSSLMSKSIFRAIPEKKNKRGVSIILVPYLLDKFVQAYSSIKKPRWQEFRARSPGTSFYEVMGDLNEQICSFVKKSIRNGVFPVAIVGDCSKTIGFLKGLRACGIEPTIIWLDAHGDFNTHESSPSGFVGGMALAILTGHEEPKVLETIGLTPKDEKDVIAYDLRALDKKESVLMRNSSIIQPGSIDAIISLCADKKYIYLHIDADVLNPDEAPAMKYPAPGGPFSKDLKLMVERLKDKIVGVSVTIWEPGIDNDKRTENAVLSIIDSLINPPT